MNFMAGPYKVDKNSSRDNVVFTSNLEICHFLICVFLFFQATTWRSPRRRRKQQISLQSRKGRRQMNLLPTEIQKNLTLKTVPKEVRRQTDTNVFFKKFLTNKAQTAFAYFVKYGFNSSIFCV